MRRLRFSAAVTAAGLFLLGGCGSAVTPQPSAHPLVKPASVTVSLRVPVKGAGQSAVAKPAYISYATQSVQIAVDRGTASESDTEVDLTTQSGACVATGILGVLDCTITLDVTPGQHTADIVTYDAVGGSAGGGQVLSATRGYPFTVVQNAANMLNFTLYGVPTSVATFPVDAADVSGAGSVSTPFSFSGYSSQSFLALPLDSDKNPIIGPGAPSMSVSVVNPGSFVVSSVVGNPNEFSITPAKSYGSDLVFMATPATGAGASSVSSDVWIAPTFNRVYLSCLGSPSCTAPAGTAISLTAFESGYNGVFTFSSDPSCTLSSPTSNSVSVNATGSALCTITATDAFGQSAIVNARFQSTVSVSPSSVSMTCSYVDGSCTSPSFSLQSSDPTSSFSVIGLTCTSGSLGYSLNGNQIVLTELNTPEIYITFNANGASSSFTGVDNGWGTLFASATATCNVVVSDQYGGLGSLTLSFSQSSATSLARKKK